MIQVSMPSRQKGPLDVALLCSKLESLQRQQEAARALRDMERRHPAKGAMYMPRSAAAQFTVTTTPAAKVVPQGSHLRRRSSLPEVHAKIKDTPSVNKRSRQAEAQVDLAVVVPAQPRDASRTHLRGPEHKVDDAVEKSKNYKPGTAASRQMENVKGTSKEHNALKDAEQKTKEHKSRRSVMGVPPVQELSHMERKSTLHPAMLGNQPRRHSSGGKESASTPTTRTAEAQRAAVGGHSRTKQSQKVTHEDRRSQFPLHPMTPEYQPRRLEAGDKDVASKQSSAVLTNREMQARRPALAKYDRADWTQQSQNGDGAMSLLQFPRRGKREHANVTPSRRRQDDHLVADAVKIIHDEQRVNRRKSVLGFFKRDRTEGLQG